MGPQLVGRLSLWPGVALSAAATVVNRTGENGTLYWRGKDRQNKQANKVTTEF